VVNARPSVTVNGRSPRRCVVRRSPSRGRHLDQESQHVGPSPFASNIRARGVLGRDPTRKGMLVGRLRDTENNTRIKRGVGILSSQTRIMASLIGICSRFETRLCRRPELARPGLSDRLRGNARPTFRRVANADQRERREDELRPTTLRRTEESNTAPGSFAPRGPVPDGRTVRFTRVSQ
jgi:hypothetical protein